jgi:hypothetical protein
MPMRARQRAPSGETGARRRAAERKAPFGFADLTTDHVVELTPARSISKHRINSAQRRGKWHLQAEVDCCLCAWRRQSSGDLVQRGPGAHPPPGIGVPSVAAAVRQYLTSATPVRFQRRNRLDFTDLVFIDPVSTGTAISSEQR